LGIHRRAGRVDQREQPLRRTDDILVVSHASPVQLVLERLLPNFRRLLMPVNYVLGEPLAGYLSLDKRLQARVRVLHGRRPPCSLWPPRFNFRDDTGDGWWRLDR
jgi:hypothetical protein